MTLLAGTNPSLTRLVVLTFQDREGRAIRQRFTLQPAENTRKETLTTPGGLVKASIPLRVLNIEFAAAAVFGGSVIIRTLPRHSPGVHQIVTGYTVAETGLVPVEGHTITTNVGDLVWTPDALMLPTSA